MGRVEHQPIGLAAPGYQRGEDPVEHAQAAPADEAVVDRLVRTILARRIAPTPVRLSDERLTTVSAQRSLVETARNTLEREHLYPNDKGTLLPAAVRRSATCSP